MPDKAKAYSSFTLTKAAQPTTPKHKRRGVTMCTVRDRGLYGKHRLWMQKQGTKTMVTTSPDFSKSGNQPRNPTQSEIDKILYWDKSTFSQPLEPVDVIPHLTKEERTRVVKDLLTHFKPRERYFLKRKLDELMPLAVKGDLDNFKIKFSEGKKKKKLQKQRDKLNGFLAVSPIIEGHRRQGFNVCWTANKKGKRSYYLHLFDKRRAHRCKAAPINIKENRRLRPVGIKPAEWMTLMALMQEKRGLQQFVGSQWCVANEGQQLRLSMSNFAIKSDWARIRGMIALLTGMKTGDITSKSALTMQKKTYFFSKERDLEVAKMLQKFIRDPQHSKERISESDRRVKAAETRAIAAVARAKRAEADMKSARTMGYIFQGMMFLIFAPMIYFQARQQGWTKPVDPILDRAIEGMWRFIGLGTKVDFVHELTPAMVESGEIQEAVGRGRDYQGMRQHMHRRRGRILVLRARAGEGKTHALKGVAYEVFHDRIPEIDSKTVRIWELQLEKLVGHKDSMYVGQMTNRWNDFTKQVDEALAKGQRVIVLIDEIHRLTGMGATSGGGSNDLGETVKAWISKMERNSNIRLFAATTRAEYPQLVSLTESSRQAKEIDEAKARRFPAYDLSQLTPDEIKQIIKGEVLEIESSEIFGLKDKAQRLSFEPGVLDRIIELSEHPSVKIANPDAALTIIDDVQSKAAVRLVDGQGDGRITLELVDQEFAERRGISYDGVSQWKRGMPGPSASPSASADAAREREARQCIDRAHERHKGLPPEGLPPELAVKWKIVSKALLDRAGNGTQIDFTSENIIGAAENVRSIIIAENIERKHLGSEFTESEMMDKARQLWEGAILEAEAEGRELTSVNAYDVEKAKWKMQANNGNPRGDGGGNGDSRPRARLTAAVSAPGEQLDCHPDNRAADTRVDPAPRPSNGGGNGAAAQLRLLVTTDLVNKTPIETMIERAAMEIRDRYEVLAHSNHNGLVEGMAELAVKQWDKEGRPAEGLVGDRPIPGLIPEKYIESQMKRTLAALREMENGKELYNGLKRGGKGPRAERDTNSLVKEVLESVSKHSRRPRK